MLMQGMSNATAGSTAQQYKKLLEALNDVAHHEINAWLGQQEHLSEPYVASCISEQLPPGQL